MVGPVTAAGPAAEAYLHALHQPAGEDQDEDADLGFVVTLVLQDSLDTHAELRKAVRLHDKALGVAADLVVAHWPSISRLAAALLDHTTLTYDECVRVAAVL